MADHLLDRLLELLLGGQEGGGVAMLLVFHHARHALHALHHLGVGALHQLGHEAGQLIQERVFHPHHADVAQGAAHDFAEHIAASFVGWQDAIVDQERGGAAVIGGDAQRGIDARVGPVGEAAEIGSLEDDGMNQVGFVIRNFALQHGGDALQAHAGIDGRARQGRQFAGRVAVELHKHQVPDFDEAAARVIGELLVLTARLGGFHAQVVMDFRTGAARAGLAHLPEVVLFVEPEDAAFGDAGHLLPQLFGLVVLAEDGDVEFLFGEAVLLDDQVPGELDGVGFEIIAERKVSQHFEEGVVAAGVADVFEVVVFASGAHAFLRAGGARVIALFDARERIFELVHARVGKQQRGIVGRHQRRTAHHAVAAGGKKIEEKLSDLVTCHGIPCGVD